MELYSNGLKMAVKDNKFIDGELEESSVRKDSFHTEFINVNKNEFEEKSYIIDINSISDLNQIVLINDIKKLMLLGLNIPTVLNCYYQYDSWRTSPVFNPNGKDEEYYTRYFMLLLDSIGIWDLNDEKNKDELNRWLKFIKDKNGISYYADRLEKLEECLQCMVAIPELFAKMLLKPIDIILINDPIIKQFMGNNLTVVNYLYHSYHRDIQYNSPEFEKYRDLPDAQEIFDKHFKR